MNWFRYVEGHYGAEDGVVMRRAILLTEPNTLLLDELTNDLDVSTLHALEDAIDEFAGCVLIISHARCGASSANCNCNGIPNAR
jgi:ABC-type cobalamin/Fe3+-siderophores transport system ATPase subunit